jgi:hypothetical protein
MAQPHAKLVDVFHPIYLLFAAWGFFCAWGFRRVRSRWDSTHPVGQYLRLAGLVAISVTIVLASLYLVLSFIP